MHFEIGCL